MLEQKHIERILAEKTGPRSAAMRSSSWRSRTDSVKSVEGRRCSKL
jgi:hypothetical protein